MTAPMPPHRQVMKGTDQEIPVCGAFKGEVGVGGICSIYENRPGCCRDFKASYEDGERSESCERARAGKGLRALEPADYLQSAKPLSDQPGLVDVMNI